jgi:glutaredoxin 2
MDQAYTKEEIEQAALEVVKYFDEPEKEQITGLDSPAMVRKKGKKIALELIELFLSPFTQFAKKLDEFRAKIADPSWKKVKDENNASIFTLKEPV